MKSPLIKATKSSLALAALLFGMTPLAAQDATQGEMILQPDGTLVVDPTASMEAPADPNAFVDPAMSAEQPVEGQILESDPAMAVDQPMDGQILEGDPAMVVDQPVDGQLLEGDPAMVVDQPMDGQILEADPMMSADGQALEGDPSVVDEQPAILVEPQGVTGIAEEIVQENELLPAGGELLPAADAAAVPLEGELLPPVDQAIAPLDGELLPPVDAAAVPPEGELLPPADQANAPLDGELLPPADAAAVPPEGELLPPADQANAPLDGELLPPADGQAATDPAAAVEEDVVIVDPNAPRVQQELPGGMVRVVLQNVSIAPLDVFVDQMDGSDPVWVMTLSPGFQVVQPSEVGQTWRLAQNDVWMGGFVPSAETEQRVTFTGAPL